ncbi:MAG TPA: hypothetical protein VN893_01330 [Bryobacteraceae bacterium]|nr:hypothetical protein [Bryobacteraceae bacterium]
MPNNDAESPVWLSGTVVTFLNKLLFPVLWLGVLGGLVLAALIRNGHISIAPGFRWFAALVIGATVFILWISARIQRVGYAGTDLVVANYWRETRVPFAQVAAVESVWWYRRRMVRVRFSPSTPFGETVYYLPKWGGLRAMFSSPEEELRTILSRPVIQ